MIEDQMMLEMENLAQRLIESVSMRSSTVIETDDFGNLIIFILCVDFSFEYILKYLERF